MLNFQITETDKNIKARLIEKVNNLTKPIGSLGLIEEIAINIGVIQNTENPELKKPVIAVFAGDHGIAKDGVSPYPQEVTYQMVYNFLNGGAGINVFANQNNIEVKVIDAGVNYNFNNALNLIDMKVAYGTKNYLNEPAMTLEQTNEAIEKGRKIVNEVFQQGTNIIGFGEMGIGNTSSASIILSKIANIPIEESVGRGAGLNDEGLKRKLDFLKKAVDKYPNVKEPLEILQHFGGFEIAMICGAMLQAAENKMIILVDGFIATSALMIAKALYENITDYCIFAHCSNEPGHIKMLNHLNGKPILKLEMRLGEGTGAAVAYPILQSAVNMLNKMASFESANVTKSV